MPKFQRLLIAASFTLLLPSIVQAEASNNTSNQTETRQIGSMPTRGMKMDAVKRIFGEPKRRYPAVGEPPITRWQYDGMMVYFEREYVIDSVATNGKPK